MEKNALDMLFIWTYLNELCLFLLQMLASISISFLTAGFWNKILFVFIGNNPSKTIVLTGFLNYLIYVIVLIVH